MLSPPFPLAKYRRSAFPRWLASQKTLPRVPTSLSLLPRSSSLNTVWSNMFRVFLRAFFPASVLRKPCSGTTCCASPQAQLPVFSTIQPYRLKILKLFPTWRSPFSSNTGIRISLPVHRIQIFSDGSVPLPPVWPTKGHAGPPSFPPAFTP